MKGWECFHANGNQKRAEVGILIPVKIDFKLKNKSLPETKDITC